MENVHQLSPREQSHAVERDKSARRSRSRMLRLVNRAVRTPQRRSERRSRSRERRHGLRRSSRSRSRADARTLHRRQRDRSWSYRRSHRCTSQSQSPGSECHQRSVIVERHASRVHDGRHRRSRGRSLGQPRNKRRNSRPNAAIDQVENNTQQSIDVGDECQWEGLKGRCVKESRCLSTLDDDSPKHPVCSKSFGEKIVCCTDCNLVNSTKNAVFIPPSGLFWKNGQKARDNCLQYLQDLPYRCTEDDFYAGITRDLDEENGCYGYSEWDVGSSSSEVKKPRAEYAHQAMLGFGEDLASVRWQAGGSIISNKYILTVAHVTSSSANVPLKFVALGVTKLSDGPTAWQTHSVKRFVQHPDYVRPQYYNDIGLIETENTITFNKNVLPACLHVAAAADETAITTTWRDLTSESLGKFADTIQTINLDKFSEEECKTAYDKNRKLKDGINYNTQMCYGSKSHSRDACKGLSGEPLLIKTQFSSCIYTVIGVTTFGKSGCGPNHNVPDVFTRVAPYKPWIESVVWA